MKEEKKAVETVVETNKDLELFGKLRNGINESRADFRRQIFEVKEAIEVKSRELKLLEEKKLKLEGAVEASDIYLKLVLPKNG